MTKFKNKPFFIRLLNWEYWPGHWLYLPLSPYFLYLALRYRHPCFFTAANPGLYTGGLGMESKYKTLQLIPEKLRPKTVFAASGQAFSETLQQLQSLQIDFPLIAKPDVGYRGLLVQKIDSPEALQTYLETYPIDFILQEFVSFPEEIGVLYYRHPAERTGHITSITQKEFLSVVGDGQSTVRALMQNNPRATLQLERLQKEQAGLLEQIPEAGEKISLGVVGNHAKGTAFINGNHLIDETLLQTFDQLGQGIPGFHYGRFDLKCQSFAELKAGKNFKVLELNGVCSEPTHIYDARKTSFFKALATIAHHWSIIGKTASGIHQNGTPYMAPLAMIRAIRNLQRYNQKIRKYSV